MRIIAGEWRGRRIAAPPGRETRPTADRVREAWMSAIAAEIPDSRVLDLFAGSGALGLEALSRGADRVVFVENAASAVRVLRSNIELLGAGDRAEVVRADALRFVQQLEAGAFDLAFADPPYGQGLEAALAGRFAEVPFARLLCIEQRASDPVPELPGTRSRRYGGTRLTFLPAPS